MPRIYLAAASAVGNEEEMNEHERIRGRLEAAMEQQALEEGGLITLLTLKFDAASTDTHKYPDAATVYMLCADPDKMTRVIENIESSLRIEIIAGGFSFAGGQNLAEECKDR